MLKSLRFSTPPSDMPEFMESKHNNIVVLPSYDIDLTTIRLQNTVDPDLIKTTLTLTVNIPTSGFIHVSGQQ